MGSHNTRQENEIETQSMQMLSDGNDTGRTMKETLNSAIGTVNDNKLLIGGLAGACGAAIFLLATDSGKRLRGEIRDRASDIYNFVCDQVGSGVDRMRDLAQKMRSDKTSTAKLTSASLRRVS